MNGAGLLVRGLKAAGVDQIFTLSGDHINPVYDACLDAGIRVIDLRSESAAAHAADGYARITRHLAVAVVTGGPGHTNALTGLATAHAIGVPVLLISGSHESALTGLGAFQELDQVALARPISKWSRAVTDGRRIPEYVALAIREALSGRPGPVHLTLPIDVLSRDVEEVPPVPVPTALQGGGEADPSLVERVLEMLREAERPVVIVGSGAWWAGAEEELRAFIDLTHLPTFTIGLSRGLLSDDHPCCFGYADPLLNGVAREFPRADVILILGKRTDYRLGFGGPRVFSPAARVIQVDVLAEEIGRNRPVSLGLIADVRLVLRQFRQAIGTAPWPERPWLAHLREVAGRWRAGLEAKETSDEVPIHPLRLCRALRELLPAAAAVAIDAGDFSQWARIALRARRPGRWLRLGPMGTLGAAMPLALGAKAAHPDTPVVAVVGDGGFAYHSWELHSAVRHGLPIVVVIGNDQAMGMERQIQQALYGPHRVVGCEFGLVRYDRVVEAMGGHGEFVEKPGELRPALERALAAGRPACVNVMIRGVPSPLTEASIAAKKALYR